MAPGQREAAVGHPAARDGQVDLVVGQAQQDPGVGPQVARTDRPRPASATVAPRWAVAGWSSSTTSMAKSWVHGMPVEAGAEHVAVLGPGVAGVGGGVDAEDAQAARLATRCATASFCRRTTASRRW